ncbi:MAG: ATP synthase F1 subunit delta [Candidatus Peribacteraceae bacterium]|nr:ATP synthase F1 subunit delta [Candidatus Peribacteraceae bacterium]
MSKISLRYARALALALGEKAAAEDLKGTADNLDLAATVLGADQAQDFFANPRVEASEKEKVTAKTFSKLGKTLENFLKLVVQHGRVSEVSAIAASFRAVLNESAGIATAIVESASELEEKEIRSLTNALKKMTGGEVAIETRTDPKILGGVRVVIGDELVDLSLAGKLSRLQKALN